MGFINQLITGGHNLVPISGLEDVPVPCWRVMKCRKTAASAEIWGSFIHSAIIKWYGSRDRSSAVMGPQRKATTRGQPVKLIKDLQRFESLTVYVWCISDLLGIYQYNSIYAFHVFLVALLELVLLNPLRSWSEWAHWIMKTLSGEVNQLAYLHLLDKSSCADDVNVCQRQCSGKIPFLCDKRSPLGLPCPFFCQSQWLGESGELHHKSTGWCFGTWLVFSHILGIITQID